MRWPWPWSNDLDTQTWPRYCQDVPPHQNWSFYVDWFKSYSPNRQTDTTKPLPLPHTREVNIFHCFTLTQVLISFHRHPPLLLSLFSVYIWHIFIAHIPFPCQSTSLSQGTTPISYEQYRWNPHFEPVNHNKKFWNNGVLHCAPVQNSVAFYCNEILHNFMIC